MAMQKARTPAILRRDSSVNPTDIGRTQKDKMKHARNIFYLVENRMDDAARELLLAQPELISTKETHTGLTPLHMAAADGNHQMVAFLVDVPGVDLSVKDYQGRTPLAMALSIGSVRTVSILAGRMYPKNFAHLPKVAEP